MDPIQFQEQLAHFLLGTYPNLDLEENLLRQIDSIALVDLIVNLESEYKIEISASEINDRNFSNITAASKWVATKVEKNGSRKP